MSAQPHILLVEDEPFLAKVIKDSLEQRNYAVTHTDDGRRAYSLFQHHPFSLCIVDVMLPQTDGFTLVRQIRATNVHVPILFLTARTATKDVIEGYESGGNDYLKKPFSLEELFLRVHELLKRNTAPVQAQETEVLLGQFTFNPHKQTLQFPNQPETRLSHRETQLLNMLYQHRNTLLDRKQVLITLWGDDSFFHTRTMDVFITKLRKQLKPDPSVEILNIRGMGYKLIC
ncbi:response regulator transcription factor [Tellurirhabdus bombi]|uniref:response regulator transcription factor n=1 Tax=Tellurirhabdus bombi TaxID=2907205 RepID=UPI001F393644|nr:response regulator transcription factor [Tellurirhabdus bombi]